MCLICPVCGEEYYYDGKICHECKGKMKFNINKPWNCGVFLNPDNTIFDRIIIDSEPKEIGVDRKDYEWNPLSSKNLMFE